MKCAENCSSVTVNYVLRPRIRRENIEEIFCKQGDRIARCAHCVRDSIGDGGGGTINGQLADTFRPKGAMLIAQFLKENPDARQVSRCRHDVVCHLAVLHAALLPNYFLV